MANTNEEKIGNVKIADDVIAACVQTATLKTPGISGFSGGLGNTISKNILGKDPVYKGIKINLGDDGVTVDISVIVDYGVKIPVVAWDVQENVKHEIEELTDLPVSSVNIHVMGVYFKEEIAPGKEG